MAKELTSFQKEFAKARREGKKVFNFNGKKYTTEMAKTPSKTRVSSPPPVESARGMGRAAMADNTRAGASKAMADTAAFEAQQRRGASEARAKAAREADAEMERESRGQRRQPESTSGMGSKITNRPAPGARSIYEDAFKKGGAVKGAGAAKRGTRPCKYV